MAIKGIGSMNNMISSLNAVAQQASGKMPEISKESAVKFSDFLSDTLGKVDLSQQQADALAKRLASGDKSVNMHEVMIAMQTATLSLQETIQVRNKIVNAYQEIMNMQV